jgi:peptidyl-prolyl cis-trans isomerase C
MSCSVKAVLPQNLRRVVSVNGAVIPHDAISRETQNHPAPTPIAAWTAAARALAVRELLLQEARAYGLRAQPATDDAGRRETDEEALVRGIVEARVRAPSPDEASCRRYYEQNLARFCSPDIFECAHILVAARRDQPEAFAAARWRAEALLAQLREKPDEFEALAAGYSDCQSRANSGNLGQVTRGMTTPDFERALLRLKAGEISPVVATGYGFHIIRLARQIPGALLPFEVVRIPIEAHIVERSRRLALAQFIALLAAKAEVVGVDLTSPGDLRVH